MECPRYHRAARLGPPHALSDVNYWIAYAWAGILSAVAAGAAVWRATVGRAVVREELAVWETGDAESTGGSPAARRAPGHDEPELWRAGDAAVAGG
jgi:hypothetical protein